MKKSYHTVPDERVQLVSKEAFKRLLNQKLIRAASLEDVHGTHHQRKLVRHPNTHQWFVFI